MLCRVARVTCAVWGCAAAGGGFATHSPTRDMCGAAWVGRPRGAGGGGEISRESRDPSLECRENDTNGFRLTRCAPLYAMWREAYVSIDEILKIIVYRIKP
jgi:hypothetical protein